MLRPRSEGHAAGMPRISLLSYLLVRAVLVKGFFLPLLPSASRPPLYICHNRAPACPPVLAGRLGGFEILGLKGRVVGFHAILFLFCNHVSPPFQSAPRCGVNDEA